jgi:sphingolipid 8-(E)-desaturase
MASTKTAGRVEALLSRREVEGLIAEGRSIIIVDQKVLKVDAWLKYHPGGNKAIMHMVGRDATDEVNGYVALCVFLSVTLLTSTPPGFTRQKHDNRC